MGVGTVGTHLSLSVRFYVEKAAINAVESVGNIIRHRRGTVVRSEGGRIKLVTVPTISAECLKHAYQLWLVALAQKLGEPVCEWCRRGEFIKHGVPELYSDKRLESLIREAEQSKDPSKALEVEKHVIRSCVVEDVGGFLMPVAVPLKRTSKVEFSFAVPTLDAVERGLCRIEMDFHVRHAPTAMAKSGEAQAVYYVENVTGVFSFVANLDVSYIGRTTSYEVVEVDGVDRVKRVELALRALQVMLSNGAFGAKRGYYHPSRYAVLSAVAVVSKPVPVVAQSGVDPSYIARTVERAERLKKTFGDEVVEVAYFVSDERMEREKVARPAQQAEVKVVECGSFEELMDYVLQRVKALEFGR